MTALLYISYSSGLSEDDKLIIDRQVSRNREKVCIVVKTLASNAKDKTKKVFDVKLFLDQFNVSTQKKAYIKKLIVHSFDQLKEHNCIENEFQLITKSGITQKTDKLIPLRIGQSKTICFYEKLKKRF